jgi:hypothetical protein
MDLGEFVCEALPDVGDPFALTLPGGLEIQDYNIMKSSSRFSRR